MKFEKLSDSKFNTQEKLEVSQLLKIVGGDAPKTDAPVGGRMVADYSYYQVTTNQYNRGDSDGDGCLTLVSNGDTATAPVGICF